MNHPSISHFASPPLFSPSPLDPALPSLSLLLSSGWREEGRRWRSPPLPTLPDPKRGEGTDNGGAAHPSRTSHSHIQPEREAWLTLLPLLPRFGRGGKAATAARSSPPLPSVSCENAKGYIKIDFHMRTLA